jgi:hypothetical protein
LSNLDARVRRWLKAHRAATWDAAVRAIVEGGWPMPLNEKVFDDQIRFVIKSDLRRCLYREAARRDATCRRPTSCGSISKRAWRGGL